MKREKEEEKKETKKAEYKKPVLTKHKKLRDVTGIAFSPGPPGLGCSKNF